MHCISGLGTDVTGVEQGLSTVDHSGYCRRNYPTFRQIGCNYSRDAFRKCILLGVVKSEVRFRLKRILVKANTLNVVNLALNHNYNFKIS